MEDNYSREQNKKLGGMRGFLLGMAAGVLLILLANTLLNTLTPLAEAIGWNNRSAKSPGVFAESDGGEIELTAVGDKVGEILGILDTYYVNGYDKSAIIENMYQGLVYGVGDPYTAYMDKESFTQYMESIEGEYTGIGVVVLADPETNSILVITPYEGYPGANAGMLPGDRIVKVDGRDVNGETIDLAVSMMKGKENTSVKVTVLRPSENKEYEFDIVRKKINIPTVTHKMLEDDIAYIRITQFDRVTLNQFKEAYSAVKTEMKGLVIDLRNNPGGLLNVVTQITDMLVPKDVIVYTEDKHGNREYTYSDANCINVPLVILVNGNSASASEVLSGAVKDLGVGELVGTTTFGKGLVQNIYECKDGSALRVTIAKYYTPNGTCIQDIGIEPDYRVEMSDDLSVRISSLSLDEDVQLVKALEVLKEKIK